MIKKFALPLLIFLFATAGVTIHHSFNRNTLQAHYIKGKWKKRGGIPKRDRIDLAWQQEFEMTRDPETGDVPRQRLYSAWVYMKELQARLGKAAIPGVQWVERGPNNQGGRARAMIVDLNDATRKTVWLGSVGGGLWKTTDITAASPNWIAADEFFQNLAINSMAQCVQNPQHIYFGTGEGYGNSDAIRGLGIWKSTNGGTSWTQLAATGNSNFYYCKKIVVVNVDTLLVATNSGIYRSVNGGSSFSKVLGNGIAGGSSNTSYDIEIAANGTIYASLDGSIHKSYNKGATWTSPLTLPISAERIELALAASDSNYVYAVVEVSSAINGILKSTNAGVSFTSMNEPVDADGGISASDFSRGQAWYDISVAVDPNNPQVLFVGAVDLFKSTDGASSWSQVAHWYGGFGFQEVHADQHLALFSPGSSSIAYFLNDGSIYRTANANASMPTIESKGNNLRTIQYYACAMHPTAGSNHFLAGAQDNGSHRYSSVGMNSTVEITGGDGCYTHIDQNQPQYQFTSYVYNNFYRSTNTGSSFSSVSYGNSGRFINPSDYDDSLNIMYSAENAGNYLQWSNPQSGSTFSAVTVTAFNGSQVSHVKVSPNILKRVYFGTGGGRIVRVDSAHSTAPVAAHINSGASTPSSYLSCIEVEKGNESHILITYSNFGVSNIWETKNGGTSWTAVDGNLPDMPVRWILLNPSKPWQALIATELGVWSTDSLRGSSTNWQPSNSGLANVRTDMLQMRASDKMVIAATHGRGLFSSDIFTDPFADFTSNKRVTYIGRNIQFTSTSSKATSYYWDFGDGTNSVIANPVKAYAAAGTYTVSLVINSGASVKVQSGFITVLPFRGIPYTPAGGGNFETNVNDFAPETGSGTGFARGNSGTSGKNGVFSGSNAWVTGLSGSYVSNTTSYLYTPAFNMTASGTYTLKFYAKNVFETSYDGYRIEYSLNGGDTWTPLGTSVLAGWYDYANTSTGRPFPQNQAYFNATRSTYTQMSYNISAFAGNNSVSFRFIFKSDANTNAAGLALDDFEVQGPANNPLPVRLVAFSGKRTGPAAVQLSWITLTERDNQGFALERSTNYNSGFEQVAFITGKGFSNKVSEYRYTDTEATSGTCYYRLRQVEADGTFVYSDIVVVRPYATQGFPKLAEQIIPAGDQNFRIMLRQGISVTLEVFGSNGIKAGTYHLPETGTLGLGQLAAGIYYFRFTADNGETQTEKVFVANP